MKKVKIEFAPTLLHVKPSCPSAFQGREESFGLSSLNKILLFLHLGFTKFNSKGPCTM
jgi:hypothetical protein